MPILGNKRIVYLSLIFVFILVLIGVFTPRKTEKSSENDTMDITTTSNAPLRFTYQPGFFPLEEDGIISFLWNSREITIYKESEEINLNTAIYPVTIPDKTIKYESSDSNVAEISSEGIITAKTPGNATITATLLSSGYTCKAELTVKRGVDSIFIPSTNIVMYKTDSYRQIPLDIFPENATDTRVEWKSKNPSVATVDENGTIKPIGKGMTEIVATTLNKKHSVKCFVQVIDEVVKPKSIEILNKQSAYLDEGQSITMIATIAPFNARDKSVSWSTSNSEIATVSQSGKIKALKEGDCEIIAKSSNGITDKVTLTVHKANSQDPFNLNDRNTSANEIPKDILGGTYVSQHPTTSGGKVTYVSYPTTIAAAVDVQANLSTPRRYWTAQNPSAIATRAQIAEYINPQNFYLDSYKYQFLDLSASNGISVEELDAFLANKGVLSGHGQAFADAAKEYNISEIYLVAHACLETGNGTSTLARGVNVNGTVVYNMFGIAAYDSGAVAGGSQMAYRKGWTSVAAAIKGGAQWISENYINNSYSQNTLYEMLWNPVEPGVHQYASDISWAISQTSNIARFADRFPTASLSYEIPIYEGETAISIE